MKLVRLVDDSKRQLEQDPNFRALGSIPDTGFTITLPTLMSARIVLVVVPYAIKAAVVARLLNATVEPDFPASILLNKDGATLYLDPDSAREIAAA